MEEKLAQISELTQKGRAPQVKALVQELLDEGADPQTILEKGLLAGMSVIGEKFKNNEVYVPEVLVAARAMNMGAGVLKPALTEEGVEAKGKVVLGTVKGDLHDIGKNLVKMMMEGKGLEVYDLGTDVPPEAFLEKAKEVDADIIACSALLTTTMGEMKTVVEKLKEAGLSDSIKIMVGGAPLNQEFCDQIGADYYTGDAASASEVALRICESK